MTVKTKIILEAVKRPFVKIRRPYIAFFVLWMLITPVFLGNVPAIIHDIQQGQLFTYVAMPRCIRYAIENHRPITVFDHDCNQVAKETVLSNLTAAENYELRLKTLERAVESIPYVYTSTMIFYSLPAVALVFFLLFITGRLLKWAFPP